MNIVFITNGNSAIGYGHISRTLILYSFFKKNNHHVKIIVPNTCSFSVNEDFIKVKSFKESDLKQILDKFGIVVIDSIEEDFDNLSWIGKTHLFIVSITLFLFDFSKRYEHLSFFPSINESEVIITNKTHIYLGNHYITFREEFNDTEYPIRIRANKILITMGGTDPYGLTLMVTKALVNDKSLSITILLSEKAKNYGELLEISDLNSNIKLVGFTENIVGLFIEHDIVFINGGLTRYESCVIGIPFIAISIHKKQFDITQELVSLGVGINLGVFDEINVNQIYSAAKKLLQDDELRRKTSLRMREMLDTKGIDRIYNIIYNKFKEYETNNEME